MANSFYYTNDPDKRTQSFLGWEDACRLLTSYDILIEYESVLEYPPIRLDEAQRVIRRRELVRQIEDRQRQLYTDAVPVFYQADEVETLLLSRRDTPLWTGREWVIECPLIVIDDLYTSTSTPTGNIIHTSYSSEEAFVRSLETLGLIVLTEVSAEQAFPLGSVEDEPFFDDDEW